ncbi:MAG TPA: hypothetical protein VF786_13650, partial [Terriglobales bacterium]
IAVPGAWVVTKPFPSTVATELLDDDQVAPAKAEAGAALPSLIVPLRVSCVVAPTVGVADAAVICMLLEFRVGVVVVFLLSPQLQIVISRIKAERMPRTLADFIVTASLKDLLGPYGRSNAVVGLLLGSDDQILQELVMRGNTKDCDAMRIRLANSRCGNSHLAGGTRSRQSTFREQIARELLPFAEFHRYSEVF